MSLIERIGVEHPVVQAGMGGGIAGATLAGAVSAAGGLGTVGILPPAAFASALHEAKQRAGAGRPVAANLLMPFTRRPHVLACIDARVDAVVLHAGRGVGVIRELRTAGIEVLRTVGTADEARQAISDGATGLVVQGVEAGGHTVGVHPTADALRRVLEVAGRASVWAAGGVADAQDVQRLLAAGADAVVVGTRFVLTDECDAHPAYKHALRGGHRTVETTLFGVGWPMRHRVLVNRAVARWGEGPRMIREANARSGRVGRVLPLQMMRAFPRLQTTRLPLFSPGPALVGMPKRVIEVTPLYAGSGVDRMNDVMSAARTVRDLLAPGPNSDPSRTRSA